ncbi:proline-rich protein 2-like [Zalophus californianus]|uniref:Proline-rich protein 2-like n=1 Tax=Zalophus californianus TaxID=9704 RepID=A0A6J2C6T1_ZALCA|nr:proline-rich protein 2-like [Zalophus californianus]
MPNTRLTVRLCGAARVSLSAEKCGPNSQDRSCPPLAGLPLPGGIRTEAAHLPPGAAPPPPAPPPGPRAPHSPPGRAPREERAEAGAGRCGLGICARRSRCPPPAPPPEVAPAAPQLLPGDRGAEKRARCPPLPPRRCHRREQRRQSRVGRAGLRSFPPRPPGRPPPARRPGQAGSSRESRARGPEPPGTPHSSPTGSALAEGGDSTPPCGGAGCKAAVATATRVAARRAEGEERSPERGRPGARAAQPHPAGPHLRAAQEPESGALLGGAGWGGVLRTHRCAGTAPGRFRRP